MKLPLSYEVEYDNAQGAGTTNSRMNFNKIKPGTLSLTFFLDGTGAYEKPGDQPIDVQQQVKQFQKTTVDYNGDIHRPNYLIVAWGTLPVRYCVLKSANIVYKLFRPNGVPLRAVITASFIDNSDDQTMVAINQPQSADLTHVRQVKEGDNLPALCYDIYEDPGYYLEVARANRLNNFRNFDARNENFLSTFGEIAIPDSRILPIPAEHREFTVKVAGRELSREHHLLVVQIRKAANKIAAARLVFVDGSASAADFPLSNADTFVPGKVVEILAGAINNQVSLFKGLVVRQSLKIREHSAPQLIVECRHRAVKLTVGRRNAYFFDQTDSEIITAVLQNAGIADPDVETTSVSHPHMVQYNATDWDFLLLRAEANGLMVLTPDDTVTVKSPTLHGTAGLTLQFGATVLEMDAEIDARRQFSAVKGFRWDAAQQDVLEVEGEDPEFAEPGNLENAALAAVVGLDHVGLQNASLVSAEAQAWANAQWLQAQTSRVCGRIKCEGIGTVNPGDLVNLAGVGDRFNGKALVTGVRHDFDTIQNWKTHIQFGLLPSLLAQDTSVAAPAAAALLPGVNGLQVGVVVSNEDPEGEDRVRVVLPLVDKRAEGAWARVAALDAGHNRGFFFRPELGDEVVVGFFNDDPRQAVILGMLPSSAETRSASRV